MGVLFYTAWLPIRSFAKCTQFCYNVPDVSVVKIKNVSDDFRIHENEAFMYVCTAVQCLLMLLLPQTDTQCIFDERQL